MSRRAAGAWNDSAHELRTFDCKAGGGGPYYTTRARTHMCRQPLQLPNTRNPKAEVLVPPAPMNCGMQRGSSAFEDSGDHILRSVGVLACYEALNA